MNYYYADAANEVAGPVSEEQLEALYRDGTITGNTNVVPEGSSDWRPYRPATPAPSTKTLVAASHAIQLERIPPPLPIAAAMQNCPFCAEQILAAAKKCKHCGETVDVTLRAAEEAKRAHAHQPMVFMNAGGGAVAAGSNKRDFPHATDLILTLVTAGIWLPFWILLYLFRNKNTYW